MAFSYLPAALPEDIVSPHSTDEDLLHAEELQKKLMGEKHSYNHSFICSTFIETLLYARNCARCLRHTEKLDTIPIGNMAKRINCHNAAV